VLLAARRAVPPALHDREAALLAEAAVRAARDATGPVCAYVPFGSEPGSPDLLDALLEAGHRVLLPVLPPAVRPGVPPHPMDWAPYNGRADLIEGPLGPAAPRAAPLGVHTVRSAALVLVPALAVDLRGVRLGRGGGWYDRTLPLAGPATRLLAVVRDDEVVRTLPSEPHDVRMTGVLTPSGGPRTLPLNLD
jgi:5-formyltetrahydrofolate cyclo-ligase